ncbi:MAG: dihydrolipoyl dehydrogenase [Halobacteriaceae archaeon]
MVVGDISTGTEVAVVGGGPGGYVAAIRAAQLGLDAMLIERDALGGVCLNHGCIPSKALLSAAGVAHEAANAGEMGVYADPEVDVAETVAWKDGVVSRLTGGVEKLCKANGVELVSGTARFAGERRLRVQREDGGETVEFEHAVVATGSRPVEVPGFDFDDEAVLDSADALGLTALPDRLVVVGAGYVGLELSTLFAKLGVDVTVVEMLEGALPGYADDLTRPVVESARDLGVEFHFGVGAEGYRETDDGVVVAAGEGEARVEVPADRVLVAVGREPVTDTLDLEAAGLSTTDEGFLATDEEARTDNPHVFAVGDVAGEPMLAHKASREGKVAAEVAAGEPAALDYRTVPAAVFTDPEVGTVGLTADAAEREGYDPVVGQFPFRASGRALTTGHEEGFVRVVADEGSGLVLGGQVVGPEASELLAELGLAIEMGATLEDVAGTVHTHPTLSEAVVEAAENAMGRAIHTLNR